MLSLKKKTEAAAPLVPPWHPNFRNYQQLPDIKVVRTAFFVNGTAAFVAIALVVAIAYREWKLRGLNEQVALAEKSIATDKADSDKGVANYNKFKEQEKRVKDVDAFTKSRPVISELALRLGEIKPKNVAYETIEIRAPETGVPTILIKGSARGAALDQAFGEIAAFPDLLRADPVLGPRLDPGQEGAAVKNQAVSGETQAKFEIGMKFRPATPPAPPAAKK